MQMLNFNLKTIWPSNGQSWGQGHTPKCQYEANVILTDGYKYMPHIP